MSEPERDGVPARAPQPQSSWRLVVPVVFVVTGLLFAASARSAGGGDLRPVGAELTDLVQERTDRVEAKREQISALSSEVQDATSQVDTDVVERAQEVSEELRPDAGFTDVSGRGLRIVLTDAPADLEVPGLDPNLLVVHQQDIQAFVNAMWLGGADAITLQGQRLISTSGIKCVGNTVLLDGLQYAPPYVIEAVGDVPQLELALRSSTAVETYREYVETYQLGLDVDRRRKVEAPAYENDVSMRHATVTTG